MLVKKMSKVLVEKCYSRQTKVDGNNIVVKIDESRLGKRKYHRGHHVGGGWVLGMVERTAQRRILLCPVENLTKNTITVSDR